MDDRSCPALNRIIRGNRISTLVDITYVSVSKRTMCRKRQYSNAFIHDLRKRAIAKKFSVRQIKIESSCFARSKVTWTVPKNSSKIKFYDEMAVTVSGCGVPKV